METVVNTHQAKTHLSQLIERAMAGERIVIAKAGKPKVVLSPIPSSEPRRPGRFAGQIHMADDFDAPLTNEELAAWEGNS
jgi:prevent-host-death family protein